MSGVNQDDLFAVIDLSDEQDNIATDLWNHPGVQDTVKRINRFVNFQGPRFKGRRIEKPTSHEYVRTDAHSDPQEVYTPPSEPDAFPEVAMGDLRKEFIEYVKRPIEFDLQIDNDYQVCILYAAWRTLLSSPTQINGKKWLCRLCQAYVHLPVRGAHEFATRINLTRHM